MFVPDTTTQTTTTEASTTTEIAPPTTTKASTTTKIAPPTTTKASTTTTPVNDHCPCNTIDHYGNEWIIQTNETKVQNCNEGAVGNASWKCDYVKGRCQFHPNQPNYSECHSLKLMEISGLVNICDHLITLYSAVRINKFKKCVFL